MEHDPLSSSISAHPRAVEKAPLRRMFAFAIDWCLIVLWGGVVFAGVMVFSAGEPAGPSGPWVGQLLGLASMTLPVLLYFTVFESSAAMRATPGKRACGLRVSGELAAGLPFGRSLLRNGLKFLPWECGHLVAQQFLHASEAGAPGWVVVPMAVSLLGPLWWAVAIATTGRAPYDRVSRAWVLHAA